MANSLVIEIVDSEGVPKCSIYWRYGREEFSMYAIRLSYGISRLSDDSTTEDILRAILEVYPEAGIPREERIYSQDKRTITEYPLVKEYADSLDIPDGHSTMGIIAISRNMIARASENADAVISLTLGYVSACDCVCDVDLDEYFCIYDYEEGTESYNDVMAKIEDIKAHAVPMGDDFFRRVSSRSLLEYYTDVFAKNEWVRYEDAYYHVDS